MSASAERVAEATQRPAPVAATEAARASDAKMGEATVILSMGELLGVTDAFVITSARNTRQVRTIVDEVEKRIHLNLGRKPWSVEGLHDLNWVLMDYGDVIVHVFVDEARAYYDLERLWGDAVRIDWEP